MARSKVRSRSHHDVLHLHPLANVPTQYQLPTQYGFRDISRTRFYRSKSLQQGQRSTQGHTMTLHTYDPNQCPYQVSTSYTLRLLRYSLDKILYLISILNSVLVLLPIFLCITLNKGCCVSSFKQYKIVLCV